ncbi:MAG: 1-acyl-sn-glycerol-3-phosphate acyltransferase [Litoreibacter sp.]|nr:1-acyl-sn-glycerol-3-phosphate acyltransferase [Litoreibacter sp.]
MAYSVQWVRCLVFNIQMYVMIAVIGIGFFPLALMSRNGAYMACHAYTSWIKWTAGWMIGLQTVVRGTPPKGAALVAAKHQSFFDVMLIFAALPRGKFIMKSLLMYAPIVGQYGLRLGCVPVNRGKRGAAVAKMLKDVANGAQDPGQLIIYPQGTRVAPGTHKPYKVGTAVLYEQMQQPCIPVATNVGVFWPKRGVYRKPGLAVIEFLEPIPPDLDKTAFLKKLESEIEEHSNRLMAEAGFVQKD